jgi:hypothetical protein
MGYKDNFITRKIELRDDYLPPDMQEISQDMVNTLIENK